MNAERIAYLIAGNLEIEADVGAVTRAHSSYTDRLGLNVVDTDGAAGVCTCSASLSAPSPDLTTRPRGPHHVGGGLVRSAVALRSERGSGRCRVTTFAYRLKARIPTGMLQAEDDKSTVELVTEHRVRLRLPTGDDGDEVVITGSGYESKDAAWGAGEQARSALRVAALTSGFAVDMGIGHERRDSMQSALSDCVRDQVRREHGVRVINEVLGLQVYPEDLPTSVFNGRASGRVRARLDKAVDPLRAELNGAARVLESRVALALDLFFSTQFESTVRSRVLTLVTALEVLAEQGDQPAAVVAHVDELRRLTRDARRGADDETRAGLERLLSELAKLRRDSLTQAVRKLVAAHAPADQQYGGRAADDFAAHCYMVRSKLVHIGEEPPDVQLSQLQSDLWLLVRAVLLSVVGSPRTS